jgi:hypothetical protein
MFADSREELDAMADMIGVQGKWIQRPGKGRREHYDICKSKRNMAVQNGAIEVTPRQVYNWLKQGNIARRRLNSLKGSDGTE